MFSETLFTFLQTTLLSTKMSTVENVRTLKFCNFCLCLYLSAWMFVSIYGVLVLIKTHLLLPQHETKSTFAHWRKRQFYYTSTYTNFHLSFCLMSIVKRKIQWIVLFRYFCVCLFRNLVWLVCHLFPKRMMDISVDIGKWTFPHLFIRSLNHTLNTGRVSVTHDWTVRIENWVYNLFDTVRIHMHMLAPKETKQKISRKLQSNS